MKTRLALLALAIAAALATALNTQAQTAKGSGGGPGFDFRKKSTNKEGSRWTLQEWLTQKDRNHLMDLWLGMYAPSPYEFYISGQMLSYSRSIATTPAAATDSTQSYRSSSGSVGAYATVIGLVGEYENNTEEGQNELLGSLNLRVLGNAVQGTHLIVSYGQRTKNQTSTGTLITLRQNFAGADLDLYLMKYFGLHGNYKSFSANSETTLGDVSGSKSEAGAFIDFGAMRIYGNWYSEKQDAVLSSTTTRTIRTGVQSGLKFFF